VDMAWSYGPTGPQAYVTYHDEATGGWQTSVLLTDLDTTGLYPRSIVAGDFNGDGLPDLLVGSPRFGASAGSIHLRKPDNTGFLPGVLQTVYTEDNGHANAMTGAAVDLDGDGDDDYVTNEWIVNRTFHGADDGWRVQSGTGFADLNGFVPVLGARGP